MTLPPLPGKEARFVWEGPNKDVILNDLRSGYPRHFVHTIGGWRSTADVELPSEQVTGGEGERARVGFRRGKTLTFEGRCEARGKDALRSMEDDLTSEFWDTTAERTMGVEVIDTHWVQVSERRNLFYMPQPDNAFTQWGFATEGDLIAGAQNTHPPEFEGRGICSYVFPGGPGTWIPLQPLLWAGEPWPRLFNNGLVQEGEFLALSVDVMVDVVLEGSGIQPFELYSYLRDPVTDELLDDEPVLVATSSLPASMYSQGQFIRLAGIIEVRADCTVGMSVKVETTGTFDQGQVVVGNCLAEVVPSLDSPIPLPFTGNTSPDNLAEGGTKWNGAQWDSESIWVTREFQPYWNRIYEFKARPLAVDLPENQPYGQNRHTGGWERTFIVTLRMHMPKYLSTVVVNAETSPLNDSSFGVIPPLTPPLELPAAAPVGSVTVLNEGSAPADPFIRIWGPIKDPEILNEDLTVSLWFPGIELVAGQYLDVDFSTRSVLLEGVSDVRRKQKGNWWDRGVPGLRPGYNTIRLGGIDGLHPAKAQITFRPARY